MDFWLCNFFLSYFSLIITFFVLRSADEFTIAELMGNAANEAKQKRLECRRSPTKRLNLSSQTEGEFTEYVEVKKVMLGIFRAQKQ